MIDPNVTALQVSRGAGNEAVAAFKSEVGVASLLTTVKPGTQLIGVAVFVDVNKDLLAPIAQLKVDYQYCCCTSDGYCNNFSERCGGADMDEIPSWPSKCI